MIKDVYVVIKDEAVNITKEMSPGVMFDYGYDGELIGIEVIDAAAVVVDREDLTS